MGLLLVTDKGKVSKKKSNYSKKSQDHIPYSFGYKLVCVDVKISKPIVILRSENAACEFIEAILKEYPYFKKVMKKHFNKNFIMSEE